MSRLDCRPAARGKQKHKRTKLKKNEEKRSEKNDLLVQEVDDAPALVQVVLVRCIQVAFAAMHGRRFHGPHVNELIGYYSEVLGSQIVYLIGLGMCGVHVSDTISAGIRTVSACFDTWAEVQFLMDLTQNPHHDPTEVCGNVRLMSAGGCARGFVPPVTLTYTCAGDAWGVNQMHVTGFVWQATVGSTRVSLDPGRGDQVFYAHQWRDIDSGFKQVLAQWPEGSREDLAPLLSHWSILPTPTPPVNPNDTEQVCWVGMTDAEKALLLGIM